MNKEFIFSANNFLSNVESKFYNKQRYFSSLRTSEIAIKDLNVKRNEYLQELSEEFEYKNDIQAMISVTNEFFFYSGQFTILENYISNFSFLTMPSAIKNFINNKPYFHLGRFLLKEKRTLCNLIELANY